NLMLMEFFNDISLARSPLSNWDDFYIYMAENSNDRVVLVFDEFPFIVDKFPEILSVLQDNWDSRLINTKLMLVLCGSSIGMMEKYTLDYKSPIYGRRTGQWMVDRLDVVHLKELFPKYTFEDLLTVYSVIDTIPGYVVKFDSDLPVWKNIETKILAKGEFLYEEVEILLREEFRDPSNYMSILSAVAGGLTRFNEIYNKTGLDKSLLSKYLSVLEKTGIIEKNQPPTLNFKRKLKAIGARYSIKDNFFDFWFRFVYTNLTELERGNSGSVVNTIQSEFPMYLGNKFERIVMELIPHFGIFKYSRIGKWWHKDIEIDIVAINENTNEILFCECKWQNRKTNVNILTELMDKARHVDWNNDQRKEYYMAASKSGFTEGATIFAKQNHFILLSSEDIEASI
ncbi:MAG: ArsR family transcriptional regulator, partial [Methanosarcinales archaeon]|nr:ArsR family transcriptional regulator [Methanosarcinales archaeon]